ncbi:MAG: hypothetical protein R3F61_03800 [Myxococcota bacterium]
MRSLPLFLLLGCPGKSPDTDDTDTPVDTDTDSPFGGDEGGLALLRTYENGELVHAEVIGIFTNEDQGFLNLAQCARFEETPCLRELPAPGMRVPYDPTDRFVATSSFYKYVGLSVELGPYEAWYVVEPELSFYYADVTDEGDYTGPADLSLGVEWGDFDLADAITVPEPLVVTEPVYEEDEPIRVFSDETAFHFEWEPGTSGRMVLVVRDEDPFEPAWVYAVEDDGSLDFDVSSLGLVGDHDLAFQLSRWSFDELDVNGNALNVQSTADATYFVRYVDVQNRMPLPPLLDACDTGFPERLADGAYYGDLSTLTNDYQEAACLQSFDAANGRDGLVYLNVPPRNELRVTYRQLASNAVMYLYDSCDEAGQVCIQGADQDLGQGPETLVRFNASDTVTDDYILVLDADEPLSGGLFFLDVRRSLIPEPNLGDTCIDALQLPNLQPGTYYQGDMAGYFNDVNPGVTGCTGSALTGPDGLVPLLVPDNVTLEVTLSMPGNDPALYLLGQCNNPNTCIEGSDVPGSIETLVYQNTTGAAQQLTLGIDTQSTTGSAFTLTVRMF